jgi:hypothetical protein
MKGIHMSPTQSLQAPRRGTVASLIAAPTLLLTSALVMPALTSDEQDQLQTIAANSTRYLWFTLFLLAGTMLFVPAFHGLTRLTAPSRALRVGGGLVTFGAMASVGDTTTQLLIRQLATRGHATPQMADVVTAFDSSVGAAQLFAVGGLALVAGGITTAIALRRAGLISWPVAAVFAAGLIANLVGFMAQSGAIITGSSALLLIGMTLIGVTLQRRHPSTAQASAPAAPAVPTTSAG